MARTLPWLTVLLLACGGSKDDTTSPTDASDTDTDTDTDTDSDTDTDTDTDSDTDSDTDTATDTDTDTTGDTGTPAAPDCDTWCTGMATTCGEEAILPYDSCMALCDSPTIDAMPLGSTGDTSGNTLGCRLHWLEEAEAAPTEPERLAACASAAASGGEVCGSWCDNYCDLAMNTCTTANPNYTKADIFVDRAACDAACAPMPTDVLDGVSVSDQQFGYGDTVLCRLHHLQVAVWQDHADLHCEHAAQPPNDATCSDQARPNTANYCAFALEFCPTLFPAGTDQGTCMGTVDALVGPAYIEGPFPSFTDDMGPTLGCLNYWIMQTPLDPLLCEVADWDPANWDVNGGAGVCSRP